MASRWSCQLSPLVNATELRAGAAAASFASSSGRRGEAEAAEVLLEGGAGGMLAGTRDGNDAARYVIFEDQ